MMCILKQVTNGCIFEEDVVKFLNSLTEEGMKKCVLCSDEAVRVSKKHFEAVHMRYSVKITLHSKPGNCLFHYCYNSKVFFALRKLNISLEVHPSFWWSKFFVPAGHFSQLLELLRLQQV